MNTFCLPHSLRWLMTLAVLAGGSWVTAQEPAGPDPIRIERKGGRPTIPEVPRDKVIGFALYTVQNGTMKMSDATAIPADTTYAQ